MAAAAASSAIVPSVPMTVRCDGRVPDSTTTAGCELGRPAAISAFAIAGSAPTPM
jgi:hypothetical protein